MTEAKSETPRTDYAETLSHPGMVSAHFARVLERENADLRAQFADSERKLRQFITLAKAQGIEITMIECAGTP